MVVQLLEVLPVSPTYFLQMIVFYFSNHLLLNVQPLNTLAEYEAISGQSINFQKSGIFFSPNFDVSIQTAITGALGISSSLDTGRYLGLPSLIGETKKAIFGF